MTLLVLKTAKQAIFGRRRQSSSLVRFLSSTAGVNGYSLEDDRDVISKESGNWIQGQVLDLAADLKTFRPRDKLDIPYELTVSESMQDFWQSVRMKVQSLVPIEAFTCCLQSSGPFCFLLFGMQAFHSQDRIHTSTPYCRKMGLQGKVLPFSLALFLTSSMTHADTAKIQVGFGKVSYLWPAFAGDTFTKTFTVDSIRNTSDGNHAVSRLNLLTCMYACMERKED